MNNIDKIKYGQIDFINCLPVNLPFQQYCQRQNTEFSFDYTSSYPKEINKKLLQADVELASISSFEYLSNQDKLELIDSLSISSKTQADSVLLFSKLDLNSFKKPSLNSIKVKLSDKSATSNALLQIILAKKYNLRLESVDEGFDAELIIGDEALLKANSQHGYEQIYDLGHEWFKLTELPMVFGLWCIRKDSKFIEYKTQIKKLFKTFIDQAFKYEFENIIIEAYKQTGISKKILNSYYFNLDYAFNEQSLKSLQLFEQYLNELGLVNSLMTTKGNKKA